MQPSRRRLFLFRFGHRSDSAVCPEQGGPPAGARFGRGMAKGPGTKTMKPKRSASPSTPVRAFPPEALKREIYRLYVLSNLFHRIFSVEIEEKDGISLIEWKTIESVFHVEGVIAKDIIDFWEFEKTAASRSIRRLERMRILKRKVSPGDQRRYNLLLTAKGRQAFGRLQKFKEYVFQDIERSLSASELHQLGDTAEKMIDHLRLMLGER